MGGARFALPFASPSGPNTWLLEQHYGNTFEAYTYGKYWYTAGQGLHFGIDLEARCGTPVVAIADGVVEWVDSGLFGAEPHNLVIRHDDAGYVSVYGHLQERPTLIPGQPVQRGQVIGQVGDPDLTCLSRPHLHLEIRSLDYRTAYNPARLISANWDMLATIADPHGTAFARDLYAPRRWQQIAGQPDIAFGNNTANGFAAAWPPPERIQMPPPTWPEFTAPDLPEAAGSTLKRLTAPDCCAVPWWAPDSRAVHYLDGPLGELAMVMAADLEGRIEAIGAAPPPVFSHDGRYAVRFAGGQTTVTRTADGATWPVATRGTWPSISPEAKQLLWHVRPADYLPDLPQPRTEIWVANIDGSESHLVRLQSGGAVQWLDEDRLLLIEMEPKTQRFTFSLHRLSTGQTQALATLDFMRDLTVAPGGRHLMFYLPFQDDPEASGIYLLETRAGAVPQKMPFLGDWRWRDSRSVLFIPFDAYAQPGTPMSLYLYDVGTGATRRLTDPAAQPFIVANADWHVSPDGQHVAFVEARDQAIWLLSPAVRLSPTPTPPDF